MNKVEQAQHALTDARTGLRTAEHEEIIALDARDRLRGLLAATLEVKEHIRLKAELEKAESRIEISHRQYEAAKKLHDEAETAFRRERDLAEQRAYRLRNVLPVEIRQQEVMVEGELMRVKSAQGKVITTLEAIERAEHAGLVRRVKELRDILREAQNALLKAQQSLALEEERLQMKRAHIENLMAAQTAAA